MKKLPKWQRKLSARLRKHIKETTNRSTLAEVRANVRGQQANGYECPECRVITCLLRTEAQKARDNDAQRPVSANR